MVVLIAESLNIMSKTLGPALRERQAKPIQEMAKAEDEAGADYIDLNIGPARKAGDELLTWVVKTVREVTQKPLSLDTTNPVAMEAGLKVYTGGRPLINSVSLQPDRLAAGLPLVKKYNAYMVGLLWGQEGMPRDAAERGMLVAELLYKANEAGIPNEDIWVDPIVTPVCVEINQVKSCLEFMSMLSEIAPGCKTTVGLSNISNGTPAHLRTYLNRCYMIMLMRHGLYSAIVDIFDKELFKIAKGQNQKLVDIVYQLMDGKSPDLSGLNEEDLKVAKSVKVLTGDALYSHSWLES
ncbi:MAG: dihydropteroate synthase [Chloroflexi bacterium]|nr:dihydropteroate synthase [Chloroflexota bacterium]